jgi:hypothetical protein
MGIIYNLVTNYRGLTLLIPKSAITHVSDRFHPTSIIAACFSKVISMSSYMSVYGSTALVDLDRFFRFLIYTQPVGLLGREISPSQDRYLHTEQHKHRIKACRHKSLEWESNPRSQRSSERRQFMP